MQSPRPGAWGAGGAGRKGLPAPLGPRSLPSAICPATPISAPSFMGSPPHPGFSRPRCSAKVWGWMGTHPNSLLWSWEARVGAVTWGGGQRWRSGRRGLAGRAVAAAFIKPGLPTPLLFPLSPPPSWAGRGWGGTLAARRVERAVQSPVTSPASVKTSGGPKLGGGREVQESARWHHRHPQSLLRWDLGSDSNWPSLPARSWASHFAGQSVPSCSKMCVIKGTAS